MPTTLHLPGNGKQTAFVSKQLNVVVDGGCFFTAGRGWVK